jgi:hypothetical protein
MGIFAFQCKVVFSANFDAEFSKYLNIFDFFQTSDDISENAGITAPTIQSIPQYTLTLDGQTLKSGQIQYKIQETAPNPPQQIKPGLKSPQNPSGSDQQKRQQDPKSNKKPKVNLIVQTTPTKQQPKVSQPVNQDQGSLQTPQAKIFGAASTLNTPVKSKAGIQIQDIKILSNNLLSPTQQTPSKQFVVPIMLKNDGSNEMMSPISNQNCVGGGDKGFGGQITYVQMKLQPNADGQPGFHLAPAGMPLLSPQAIQQLSFASPQISQAPQIHQVQTLSQANQTEIKTTDLMEDMDQDDNMDYNPFEIQESEQENEVDIEPEQKKETQESPTVTITQQQQQVPATSAGTTSTNSTTPGTITIVGTPRKISSTHKENPTQSSTNQSPNNLTKLQVNQQEQSEIAIIQLSQLSSHSIKHQLNSSPEKAPGVNLTICEVCKKEFKKKEHLMQHLKSHVGLRPFKCKDAGCNKSFSRKEHLLRYWVLFSDIPGI